MRDVQTTDSRWAVTLLTDFGTRDGYAAAMKGVILSTAPGVAVVDAGHDIPPFDIQAGAWALRQYWNLFPPGTVHIVVVDPGVGTDRAALAIEADERVLIGPDNGVLAWAAQQAKAVRLQCLRDDVHRRGVVSATFHGRDVFAYAAALIASGQKSLDDLTVPVDEIVRPAWLAPREVDGVLTGEIVHVDRFGNLITNIPRDAVKGTVLNAGHVVVRNWVTTYAAARRGEVVALVGSSGFVEIAMREASAAEKLGLGRGVPVRIE